MLRRIVPLLGLCATALQACGGSEVSGQLSAPDERGSFKPTGGVEVLLVKGDVVTALDKMKREDDARVNADIAQDLTGAIDEERRTTQAELDATIASLRSLGHSAAAADGGEGPPRIDCVEKAQKDAEQADQRFQRVFDRLRARLTALGIESTSPATARAQLEATIASKLEQQAALVQQAHAEVHLKTESSVLLGSGASPDQLCWSIFNNGPFHLVDLDLRVTYNGKTLPAEVAEQVWVLPRDSSKTWLRVRNEDGEEIHGLPSKGTLRLCVYATNKPLTAGKRELEPYGLTRDAGPRSGTWRVEWRSAVFSAASPTAVTRPGALSYWEFAPQPATVVFAQELGAYRRALPEAVLLAELTTSDDARALERATSALTACRKAAELQQTADEIEAAAAAVGKGKATDDAVRARIAPRIEKLKQDVHRRGPVTTQAQQSIEKNLSDFRKTEADGKFVFPDVPDGDYTLVATTISKAGLGTTWLVPIRVDGNLTQALNKSNAEEGSLTQALEFRLFGVKPVPLPPPKVEAEPATKPAGKKAPAGAKKPPAGKGKLDDL